MKNIIDYLNKYNITPDSNEEMRWIYINGEKTKYIASSYGYIISFNFHHRTPIPKKLKEKYKSDGYHRVILVHNTVKYTFLVHRLIATAFIPNPHNKPQVNHKDGNKGNNNIENLEWVTQSENMIHSYKHNLRKPAYGSAKLSKETVEQVCKMIENGDKEKEIIDKLNITESLFRSIKYGLTWTSISKKYSFRRVQKRTRITEDLFNTIKESLYNNIPDDEIITNFKISKITIRRIKNSKTFNDYRKRNLCRNT